MSEFNISPSKETQEEISQILNEAVEKLRDKKLMLGYYWVSIEMHPSMLIKEIKITNGKNPNKK